MIDLFLFIGFFCGSGTLLCQQTIAKCKSTSSRSVLLLLVVRSLTFLRIILYIPRPEVSCKHAGGKCSLKSKLIEVLMYGSAQLTPKMGVYQLPHKIPGYNTQLTCTLQFRYVVFYSVFNTVILTSPLSSKKVS